MKILKLLIFITCYSCISIGFLSSMYNVVNPFFQIFGLILLLYVPGALIIGIFKIRFLSDWHYIVHSLGISIGFQYLFGLVSSVLLPRMGLSRPLDPQIISVQVYALFVLFLSLFLMRFWNVSLSLEKCKKILFSVVLYILATGLGVLTILGSIYLENTGSNYLQIGILTILLVAIFFSSQFKNKISEVISPYLIFSISLTMLWMLSSRSFHLIGWDIVQEYQVGIATINAGRWSMENVRDAYNACLSITIFPAVISNVTGIHIELLLKYLFPFVFAHFPVTLYLLYKTSVSRGYAMLATVYLVGQPFFIQPMIALARQELAFYFFALVLSTVHDSSINRKTTAILSVFYILFLVFSHYSTSYVSILIFFIVVLITLTVKIIKYLPIPKVIIYTPFYQNWIINFRPAFKWWMFITMLFFTYLWYFILTNTAGNVQATVIDSVKKMPQLFSGSQQSQEVKQALPGVSNINYTTQNDINLFIQTHTGGNLQENLSGTEIVEIIQKYPVYPMAETLVLPSINREIASAWRKYLDHFKEILKYTQIMSVLILIAFSMFKKIRSSEAIVFSAASVGIMLLMILHPTLGLTYNISRIYLQLLIFLSLTFVSVFASFPKKYSQLVPRFILVLLVLINFVYQHGLLLPLIGGIPVLHLYNFGTDYEKFFVYQQELVAAEWLQINRDYKSTVYADDLTGLRLRKQAAFFPNTTILPLTIANNGMSYVYLSVTNTQNRKAQVSFKGKFLVYEYPINFLNDNKNIVYSNQKSLIYK